jgi:hypothetical protein
MSSLLLRVAVVLTFVVVAPHAARAARSSAAGVSAQETPRELVEKIKDQKDRSPGAWFETLGARRDAAGLKALEQALGIVKSEAKLSEVARALRHFAGDSTHEGRALQVLRGLALERAANEARAGAAGLAAFGPSGEATLREIIGDIQDDLARARALAPLLPSIEANPDAKGLALFLAAWRTPQSGEHARGLALLQSFRTTEHLELMGKFVSNEDGYRPRRELVLAAVGAMKLEGEAADEADEVVDRGLAAEDVAVQFRALEAVIARGRALRRQPLEALTRVEADELRRLAHVALARLELAASGGDPKQVVALGRAKDPAARQAAALELARLGSKETLAILGELLADPDTRVRSEAIRAVAARRRASSIEALIDRLDAERGKLGLEVQWALRMLTGLDHGARSPRWRAWWTAEGETFELPTLALAQEAERARKTRRDENSTKASFYGLQVVSNRLSFVIDISGSMREKAYAGKSRIDIAKEELTKVVESLQADDHFNLIAFSSGVDDWQKALVPGDPKNRASAQSYVQGLNANGGTAIFDALARAFEDKSVDTIYFLSDGDPSAGAIVDPTLIRSEIARWNSARHVTIHCIAVGQDHALLRGLAEDSGGTYQRID